jgi:secondary thiamine-phosphate synthase enzyme
VEGGEVLVITTETLLARSSRKKQVLDLTAGVNQVVEKSGVKEGICLLFAQHTTACLALGESGEGTDEDLLEVAQAMIPKIRFRHGHDPSHAPDHMASSVMGQSLTIPVLQGELALGTWQSVLLLEFNGPRERSIIVQVLR